MRRFEGPQAAALRSCLGPFQDHISFAVDDQVLPPRCGFFLKAKWIVIGTGKSMQFGIYKYIISSSMELFQLVILDDYGYDSTQPDLMKAK